MGLPSSLHVQVAFYQSYQVVSLPRGEGYRAGRFRLPIAILWLGHRVVMVGFPVIQLTCCPPGLHPRHLRRKWEDFRPHHEIVVTNGGRGLGDKVLHHRSVGGVVVRTLEHDEEVKGVGGISNCGRYVGLPFAGFSNRPIRGSFVFANAIVPRRDLPRVPINDVWCACRVFMAVSCGGVRG